MKIYFNNLGVVTSVDTTGDSLRQGSVGVELEAHFEDVDNSEYTATLNFTRSDGISISGVIMALDQSNSEVYNYKFMDPWFFAKAGTTTLSIYLRAADGTIKAQGQVTFSIEATDYDEEPTITITQYNELITMIEEVSSGGERNVLEGVKLNGVDLPIDANKKVNVDISGKANKVSNPVDGHLASLDENGDIEDSGYASSKIGELDQRVDNLENIGKFLSIWDAENGVALTNPPSSPYTYRTGDYFRVGTAGNKVPTNTQYVIGGTNYTTGASLSQGDLVYFDGTQWIPQASGTSGNVISVAGKTGIVTLNKGDVGLGNADNTSDLNKPISNATQAALNLKADKTELLHLYMHYITMENDEGSETATLSLVVYSTSGTPLTSFSELWTLLKIGFNESRQFSLTLTTNTNTADRMGISVLAVNRDSYGSYTYGLKYTKVSASDTTSYQTLTGQLRRVTSTNLVFKGDIVTEI